MTAIYWTGVVTLDEPEVGQRKPLIPTLGELIEYTALLTGACAEGERWGAARPDSIAVIPPEG